MGGRGRAGVAGKALNSHAQVTRFLFKTMQFFLSRHFLVLSFALVYFFIAHYEIFVTSSFPDVS